MDALEQRVAEIEARIAEGVHDRCPKCSQNKFHVIRKEDHMDGDVVGLFYRVWCCDNCGYEERKLAK